MAKRAAARASTDGQPNPRQACPCGSGKRYKACHGVAGGAPDTIVTRPFEGLAGECDLIALREFVPSATAVLPLAGEPGREVTLASVLPMASAAMVREDGNALVGLQVQTSSVDLSRDLARAIEWTLSAEPGAVLQAVGPDNGTGTNRLQDVLRAGQLLPSFAMMRDDGKTSGGCWIYTGVYTEAGNMSMRRDGSDPTGLGIYPNWGFSWPANRRVLYNRASADPNGKPWSERKKYVWWSGSRWTSLSTQTLRKSFCTLSKSMSALTRSLASSPSGARGSPERIAWSRPRRSS